MAAVGATDVKLNRSKDRPRAAVSQHEKKNINFGPDGTGKS